MKVLTRFFTWNRESYCFGCGRYFSAAAQKTPLSLLCIECCRRLPVYPANACALTGATQPAQIALLAAGLDEMRAMYFYDDLIAEAIRAYKYGRGLSAFKLLRELCQNWCRSNSEFIDSFDMIAVVPSHWTTLLKRGFNPPMALISGAAKQRVDPRLVKKIHKTPPMASLSAVQRRKLRRKRLFKCRTRMDGKSVLIFDDVMTTAATVENLARCLRKQGAKRIGALVLARNLPRVI